MYSRLLSTEELARYSDCQEYSEKIGNVINPSTEFEVTGTLIKAVEISATDVLCTSAHKRQTINVHVPFLSFYDAQKACDKYSPGSMVGPFEVKIYCIVKTQTQPSAQFN